jgi:hypothetical protein
MGGLSNKIYSVNEGEKKLIIKMFSNYFMCLLDRGKENRISHELGEKGMGPKVLYYDSGFRLENYLEKESISVSALKESRLLLRLSEVMVHFHKGCFERESYLENNSYDLLVKNNKI